eukprot:TRINITY_DN8645_c0_g1_i1.p1 TRINITY_DN8645_c0_g1~~TRINITY_DN8645_c0_g1_i1.p1  ORF type:complete len:1336 (+),score=465.64 TRINITY_DN8645_c0_g1_i1:81-4088(+)
MGCGSSVGSGRYAPAVAYAPLSKIRNGTNPSVRECVAPREGATLFDAISDALRLWEERAECTVEEQDLAESLAEAMGRGTRTALLRSKVSELERLLQQAQAGAPEPSSAPSTARSSRSSHHEARPELADAGVQTETFVPVSPGARSSDSSLTLVSPGPVSPSSDTSSCIVRSPRRHTAPMLIEKHASVRSASSGKRSPRKSRAKSVGGGSGRRFPPSPLAQLLEGNRRTRSLTRSPSTHSGHDSVTSLPIPINASPRPRPTFQRDFSIAGLRMEDSPPASPVRVLGRGAQPDTPSEPDNTPDQAPLDSVYTHFAGAADVERGVLRAIGHEELQTSRQSRSSIDRNGGFGLPMSKSDPNMAATRERAEPEPVVPTLTQGFSFMGRGAKSKRKPEEKPDQRAARAEATLQTILRLLTTLTRYAFDPARHVPRVMERAQKLLKADGCCYWFFENDDDATELWASSGSSDPSAAVPDPTFPQPGFRKHLVEQTRNSRRLEEWPPAQDTLRKRSRDAADLAEARRSSRRHSASLDNSGVYFAGAALAAPVRSGNAVVAVAVVWWRQRDPCSKDTRLFEALAQVAGVATRDTRLLRNAVEHSRKAQAMLDVAESLGSVDLGGSSVTSAIMESARKLANADKCSLFIVQAARHQLLATMPQGGVIIIPMGSGIVGHVAATGDTLNIRDVYDDPRFNREVDVQTRYRTKAMLCVPVKSEGKIVAVAQLINKKDASHFSKSDIELFDSFAVFAGLALRNLNYHTELMRQRKTTEVVLQMVRQLAETDIRNMSSVVDKVIKGAKELCAADRCALFLVEEERRLLRTTITGPDGDREITVPIGSGIAGDVAQSGEALNIADAYADSRFNQEVDKKTGYRTQGIMAYPILHNGAVVAVAQLINKIDPMTGVVPFEEQDEDMLMIFAEFAGVAIGNARLYEFVLQAGNQAMDLFAQMQGADTGQDKSKAVQFATDEQAAHLQHTEAELLEEEIAALDTDAFPIHDYDGDPAAQDRLVPLITCMLRNLGLTDRYRLDEAVLYKLLGTVKNMYRPVPYHNFIHAFDVTQTLYYFLHSLGTREMLQEIDVLALMLCGVFHDVDHMGLNNSFHLKAETPLGLLSSASGSRSVLEVHHCSVAIEILQNEATNVLAPLTAEESKHVFKVLINTILATDMARHAELCADLTQFCDSGTPFDRSVQEHRIRAITFMMKCADISNPAKPFDIGKKWGIKVTEEFHTQGEQEKKSGVSTLPAVMLAGGHRAFAKGQEGFSSAVVLPMYNLACRLIPNLDTLRRQCAGNLATWRWVISRDVAAHTWGMFYDHGILYCYYFKLSGFHFGRRYEGQRPKKE